MPALYSHTTRATGTVLTATIYNGDHQNHIDNGTPAQHDDYSATVGQMQTNTNPGGIGSESLATSTAGELERIRYVLKQLRNGDQWYAQGSAPGARSLIDFQVFTSSGTWTKPAGCNAAFVQVMGGGGGGGGAPATSGVQTSVGSGGGGGGYVQEFITSGLGATETVTIGAGGAGGVGVSGSNGSNSSFGAHATGNGGVAGGAGGPTTASFGIVGGAGGGSSGSPNNNFIGGCGYMGFAENTNQTAIGGAGGNSFFSGGAPGVFANTAGNNAIANTGGGGGGAANGVSQSARTGGTGGSGIVIVTSYT